jgi:hypothetical protein
MKFFKGLALIFLALVWALFWLESLALITNDPSYSDMRALQTMCYFVMLIAVAPFGFGLYLLSD